MLLAPNKDELAQEARSTPHLLPARRQTFFQLREWSQSGCDGSDWVNECKECMLLMLSRDVVVARKCFSRNRSLAGDLRFSVAKISKST